MKIQTGSKGVVANVTNAWSDAAREASAQTRAGKRSRLSDGMTKEDHEAHAQYHAARADQLEADNGGHPTNESNRSRDMAEEHLRKANQYSNRGDFTGATQAKTRQGPGTIVGR
jgi:uncharacterized lipoprotein NlpE involved in copper resistance